TTRPKMTVRSTSTAAAVSASAEITVPTYVHTRSGLVDDDMIASSAYPQRNRLVDLDSPVERAGRSNITAVLRNPTHVDSARRNRARSGMLRRILTIRWSSSRKSPVSAGIGISLTKLNR